MLAPRNGRVPLDVFVACICRILTLLESINFCGQLLIRQSTCAFDRRAVHFSVLGKLGVRFDGPATCHAILTKQLVRFGGLNSQVPPIANEFLGISTRTLLDDAFEIKSFVH